MRISLQGYLGQNHSWSITSQNIARAIKQLGHNIELQSTNSYDHFPNDLQENISDLNGLYDMQLSYTAPRNWQYYFNRGSKNRFVIFNYETTCLPPGTAKQHIYIDKLLPSSNFSKKIFIDGKIPEDKQVVIPHGVDAEKFVNAKPYQLKTRKSIKILANIAQPHLRKNLPGILEAYGKAFTSKNDVCLVMKVVIKKPEQPFELYFPDVYAAFKNKYKDHAEVEIVDEYIDDIETLYAAIDIIFTMTKAECFWLPGLEGFAANKLVISPRYGGQLDYMNDTNSLLIDGKVVKADRRAQYWTASPFASYFEPSVDHASQLLKQAVSNYDSLLKQFSPHMQAKVKELSWENAASKIINLCI